MIDTTKRLKKAETKRLFENSLLEKLTHTHIAVPVSIFLMYSVLLLYFSITLTTLSIWITIALFIVGLLFFTWVEYNVHRYIFHIPGSHSLISKFRYIIHGVHHEYPKDKTRLAMPPVLSITIATLLLVFWYWLMEGYTYAFLSGFLVGYAVYLTIHYKVHAHRPPQNKWLRALWINHALHHYVKEGFVFGVSSPLWDYIYGTMMPKGKKRPSSWENSL